MFPSFLCSVSAVLNNQCGLSDQHLLPQMKCCGWTGPGNWSDNLLIKNSSQNLYPCSCRNETLPGPEIRPTGLCEHLSTDLPVYETVRDPLI